MPSFRTVKPMSNPLPKTNPKRRWLQFSIRTVLLLVTLLCVGLSLWIAPAERQRRAVTAIETLGGAVVFVTMEEAASRFPQVFYGSGSHSLTLTRSDRWISTTPRSRTLRWSVWNI